MYRFLLKPLWILSHLFIIGVVVLMVNLGFWQLQRLDERKAFNAAMSAAIAQPAQPIGTLVPAGVNATHDEVESVKYRSVSASGVYLVDQQVLVTNRTQNGAPGYWVLTPLDLGDGTALVINRGWIPYSYTADGSWSDFAPPVGPVSVIGTIEQPQVRASGGVVNSPADAAEGTLRTLARVDVARLGRQVDERLFPLYVNLQTQTPPQPEELVLPAVVPPPRPLRRGTASQLRDAVVHVQCDDARGLSAAAASYRSETPSDRGVRRGRRGRHFRCWHFRHRC